MTRLQSESESRAAQDDGGVARRAGGERGFAAMDQDRQRAIASEGGRAAHRQGVAHEFSSEEARAAGRKGGAAVSQDRGHMAAIGAMGGRARADNLRARSITSDTDGELSSTDLDRDVASSTATTVRPDGTERRH